MRSLIQFENAKTTKGESLGVRTGILYLAPANESGVMDTCPMRTDACTRACLFTAGRGAFDSVRHARISKTLWFHTDRAGFVASLKRDVAKHARKSRAMGMRPAVRINGTSDLPKLALEVAAEFPEVQFYDYTKIPRPWDRMRANYHLTFSYSGENLPAAMDALAHGVNVAVVFTTKKGESLPESWNGYQVIDGDTHDCRFLDPQGVVIGLRAKGKAKGAKSPFVVLAA